MNALDFTIAITAISGMFLVVFGYLQYKWTKHMIWTGLMLLGIVFLVCATLAISQKRAVERQIQQIAK